MYWSGDGGWVSGGGVGVAVRLFETQRHKTGGFGFDSRYKFLSIFKVIKFLLSAFRSFGARNKHEYQGISVGSSEAGTYS